MWKLLTAQLKITPKPYLLFLVKTLSRQNVMKILTQLLVMLYLQTERQTHRGKKHDTLWRR